MFLGIYEIDPHVRVIVRQHDLEPAGDVVDKIGVAWRSPWLDDKEIGSLWLGCLRRE